MALQTERLKNQGMSGGASESRIHALWERIRERPQRWGEFLHDVRLEMHQVNWPSRETVISTTGVVIVAVAFFGLFFLGVDSTVGLLLQRLIGLFGR